MSRKIKFRAWDQLKREMVYGVHVIENMAFYIGPVGGTEHIERAQIKVGAPSGYPPIMQFTGMKDKRGRDIYEGDILNENGYAFLVVFNEMRACFELKHGSKSIQYPGWNRGILMGIIGNIHENPELVNF